MSYKLAQLNLPAKAKKAQTLSDIFISQPDSIKEALAGKLLMLVEIDHAGLSSLKLINYLFHQLNNNYYQNDKIILRERISTLKPEHIFETALAKTNKDLENFIKQEKIKIPLSAVNVSAALVYGQHFHFASTGKNKIFLFYRQDNAGQAAKPPEAGSQSAYRISDLGKASAEPAGKTAKLKFFNNVVSGKLPPRSFVMIANEALPEYISEKKLVAIISTLSPLSAVEQIKSLLANVNSYVSFQSLIIKITQGEPEMAENIQERPAPSNIPQLNATETETEKILSPSGLFNLRRWAGILSPRARIAKAGKTLDLKDKSYARQRSRLSPARSINAFRSFAAALSAGVWRLLKLAAKTSDLKLWIKKLYANTRLFLLNSAVFFFRLSLKKKLLLLTVVISVVLLSLNIKLDKKEQARVAEKAEFAELIAEIEKKQHQAEASLLYSNEAGAQKLFAEITELMEKLPQITEEQRATYEDFQARLEIQLEKTSRVVRFKDKEVIADLRNINPATAAASIFVLENSTRLYAADPDDAAVYIIDLGDSAVTVAADTGGATADLRYPAKAGAESVYYFGGGGVVEIKTDNDPIQNLSINLLGDAGNFVAAGTYNNRYYLLNRQESQIYRYNRSGNAFSSPYAWIQETANLSQAIDLTIDGYIYVLLSNGNIIKYLSGRAVDFKLEAVDPPLLAPAAIWASPELKQLYVLEPKEARLLMYDKSGQFLEQYKDDFLKNAKDFAIDEGAKQMYFLSGVEILKTPAPHLE